MNETVQFAARPNLEGIDGIPLYLMRRIQRGDYKSGVSMNMMHRHYHKANEFDEAIKELERRNCIRVVTPSYAKGSVHLRHKKIIFHPLISRKFFILPSKKE